MNMRRRNFLWGSAVVLGGGALGLGAAELLSAAASLAAEGDDGSFLPNTLLTSHEGRSYRFYDDLVRGKKVVINFFYAGCGDICPLSTQRLVEVQQMLNGRVGRDLHMYSITLQPEMDTRETMLAYMETYGVGPGWLFLRASKEDTEILRRRLGFVDPDPVLDADLETHIGVVKFGNDAIGRWAACPSFADPEEILASILTIDEAPARGT
ncbi:SCO family protein (plasmid) [Skermanella rosea]|uniref:SCO family protein n=1 Tax=Skermanella rosea TaxID=1817965 RepID=UPI0019336533|nr:SCO family protein [Skermanella rosea]UEM07849.1 SCO family protein [Skermanella rosea]